jgi:AcrR family transcriptional regulator
MARPREFERDEALVKATAVFWDKGYAATSTGDLLKAMGIGRQSLYNAFGDKRRLYLEALERYQADSTASHLRRLDDPISPLEGLKALLVGLIPKDDRLRAMGCLGVGALGEFGISDAELVALRAKAGPLMLRRLVARIREGQGSGEIDPDMDPEAAAQNVQLSMQALQLGARAGASWEDLRDQALFIVNRLKRP